MANDIKAGVPFVLKVNTKADRMGFESGFKMQYFDDATQTVVNPAGSFFEFTDTAVDGTGATTLATAAIGDTVLTPADMTGYVAGAAALIGGNYYRVKAVDASTITLKNGLTTAVTAGDAISISGRTGTYGMSVTVPAKGNYTFHITNYAIGMDNEPAPIHVKDATVDDVKSVVDALKTELDLVKGQVDTLDETTVNGISAKVDALATELSSVHTLIQDSTDVQLTYAGDVASAYTSGATVTGDTSGATGTVQSSTYDATSNTTSVVATGVTGTYQVGETTDGGAAITGTANNTVNSVFEFVKEIQDLLKSGTGLDALSAINNDLEHMIKGDATLEDGSVNPTNGKGLVQIFDEIANTHVDLSTLKTLAEDATNGFAAIRTAIDNARTSIEGKVDGISDLTNPNSLASKIAAVKTVVDANGTLLNDSTNGLASIKTTLDLLSVTVATGGTDVLTAVAGVNTLVTNLGTALDAQTAHIDGRFDSVMSALGASEDATKYSVFA